MRRDTNDRAGRFGTASASGFVAVHAAGHTCITSAPGCSMAPFDGTNARTDRAPIPPARIDISAWISCPQFPFPVTHLPVHNLIERHQPVQRAFFARSVSRGSGLRRTRCQNRFVASAASCSITSPARPSRHRAPPASFRQQRPCAHPFSLAPTEPPCARVAANANIRPCSGPSRGHTAVAAVPATVAGRDAVRVLFRHVLPIQTISMTIWM